jgi:hypothetical protein
MTDDGKTLKGSKSILLPPNKQIPPYCSKERLNRDPNPEERSGEEWRAV